MAHSTPTHRITHKYTGTTADVRIAPSVQANLTPDSDPDKRAGAEKHVAVAFKHTTPRSGRAMGGRYVDYNDLEIAPIVTLDAEEPHVPMDHHGDPIDPDFD